MTRKDLEKVYHISGTNNEIRLYKDCKYRGTISLVRGKARILGPIRTITTEFTDLESLASAVSGMEKELRWDIDTYNPGMNNNYRHQIRVHQYMLGLGFDDSKEMWGGISTYTKKLGPNNSFDIYFLWDENSPRYKETKKFLIETPIEGEMFIRNEFSDEEDVIPYIETYIKYHVLSSLGDSINILNKVDENTMEFGEMYKLNWGSFSRTDIPFKESMVAMLEHQLELVKSL